MPFAAERISPSANRLLDRQAVILFLFKSDVDLSDLFAWTQILSDMLTGSKMNTLYREIWVLQGLLYFLIFPLKMQILGTC